MEHVPDHKGSESETPGVGELLPPRRKYDDLSGTGQLASAETAGHPMAAVEAEHDPSEEPDQTGIIGRRGMAVRQNPAWALGHRRDEHHAPGPQEFLLRKPGTVLASEAVPTTTARFMNRRVRNRSHGGVGGRRGRLRLLPD